MDNKGLKQTAVVIGRADAIKLGLIRSLGEYGCNVISIHLVTSSKVRVKPIDYYSKYVSQYYFSTAEDLIRLLVEKCLGSSCKPILFPLDDKSVYLIDEAYNKLRDLFLIANAGHREKGVISLMDKFKQKELARKAGLKVAKGWVIPYKDGNFEIPADIEFPCFVKVNLSYVVAKKLQKRCDNKEELLELLNEAKIKCPYPFIAEEYISAENEVGFIGVTANNECIIPAKVVKTSVGKGTANGVTMCSKITPLSPDCDLVKSLKTFLLSMDYTGISNLDFIEYNGNLYFLEANFRYAAFGFAYQNAGVNLPALCVSMMTGTSSDNLSTVMDRDVSYFNEKIAITGVIEKNMSWKRYFELSKSSDCPLIASSDDPSPYRHFMLNSLLRYIKSFV